MKAIGDEEQGKVGGAGATKNEHNADLEGNIIASSCVSKRTWVDREVPA